MKDLYILDSFKEMGGCLLLEAQDQFSVLYNVSISISAFRAYLGKDDDDNMDLDSLECNDLNSVAQEIYDAWSKGHTTYDVVVVRQKLKGYRFTKQDGGFRDICKSWVSNPIQFKKENNYTSYTPIFG